MVFKRGQIQQRAHCFLNPSKQNKTKQNKTLLFVLVGDVQRAGIVVTPPTFTCLTNAIIIA
jgi:hypothetical protein